MHELRRQLAGQMLLPGDAEFDEASEVWNARFESRPDVIVRCAGPEDVVAAVNHARDRGVPLTIKGGGHDYAGRSASRGGLLVDMSPLDSIRIDVEGRRARVGAGATWGAFDRRAQEHGLATPGPTVSAVGVAGATLGGGEGWLLRKHGLTADNLLSVELVTAAGELVVAAPDENTELFWALRGGGGNFGVVTSFEYRLHEVGPEVVGGQIIYPADDARALLRAYREYCAQAPDDVACYAFFLRIPPVPDFPQAFHGKLALDFVVAYAGPVSEGERALKPLRELGDTFLDTVSPVSYVALQQSFDAALPKGNRWYSRAHCLDALPDEAIGAFVERLDPFPGAFTTAYLGAYGGAFARVAAADAAVPHRDAAFGVHVLAGWSDPAGDEAAMAWCRGVHDALAAHRCGVYVNLLGEDESTGVRDAYGDHYARLAAVKREWDPTNLFRSNHNIEPD